MPLDATAWGAIATAGGAVVSLVAAGLAFWQAQIARGARAATEDQAKIAKDALDLQRAQQDQADAPTFALEIEPAVGEYACSVKVTMTGGPQSVMAVMTYENGWGRHRPDGEYERHRTAGGTMDRRPLVKNASTRYSHMAPAEATTIWSTVTIATSEVGGEGREWQHVERAEWANQEKLPWTLRES